jgi:hypothetical protein
MHPPVSLAAELVTNHVIDTGFVEAHVKDPFVRGEDLERHLFGQGVLLAHGEPGLDVIGPEVELILPPGLEDDR